MKRSPGKFLSLILLTTTLGAGTVQNGRADESCDYRSRTIYFALTDRFHAQDPYQPYVDPQYPNATNSVNCFTGDCDTEVQYRSFWGGDIPGFIQKLDYLKDMGIGAVWLAPMFEGVRDYGTGIGYGTDYHGYWVTNYDRVNPHFGTWEQVRQLSQALHQHGMRYIQDITLNDSNPNDVHVFGRLYYGIETDQVLIDSYADDFDFNTGLHFYKHFDSDPRCVQDRMTPDGQQTYWQLHHCSLADLSGYNQHNKTIADYLIDAGELWLTNGVDDFRLDAVKYPFPDFIASFTHEMIEKSTLLGRGTPYIVGEWSDGGVGDAKSLAFANRYDIYHTNLLDFQLAVRLNQYVGGAAEDPSQQFSGQDLATFLTERVTAFHGRDDWQGTFIDNHDQMRTVVRLHKLGVSVEESKRRLDLATVLLMTVRGIPIILYGDEQYLGRDADNATPDPKYINGWDDDPWNRVGMMSFSEDTPAFKIIKTLAKLRQDCPAVQRGDYTPLYADQDVLVFKRQLGSETVVVGVNRSAAAQEITVPVATGLAPGSYESLLDPAQNGVLVITPEGFKIQLGSIGAVVVRLQ